MGRVSCELFLCAVLAACERDGKGLIALEDEVLAWFSSTGPRAVLLLFMMAAISAASSRTVGLALIPGPVDTDGPSWLNPDNPGDR